LPALLPAGTTGLSTNVPRAGTVTGAETPAWRVPSF
jgi:hypothetical protein